MAPNVKTMRNVLMELRKICQHPYLSAPELEDLEAPEEEQQKHLIDGSGKLAFLKLLLPKLKERGHRVLLFSQFKIALDRIEDFLYGEGYKFLRLDGDVQQAQRQKSMDAFNAPDSDYFIFLLTTRAGGVGINLATADTVIVYDPDFNPHMDLQAIARAHRFGQKKKVMVFKLMTKNSVEEQIILNGKKKMVLDHLVVQQMDKQNEEGDIDNMLLHGAAALYEAGEDGVAASDIRYTSQNVDELIDKVQKDADDEAATMASQQAEERAGGSEEPAKAKESMSFGFAKIWEADTNRLEEIEDKEVQPDDDDDAFRLFLTNLEEEKRRKVMAGVDGNAKLQRRSAAALSRNYGSKDGVLSDSTPKKDWKGKGKKGKKGKGGESSSDVDFSLIAASESDDDSDMSDGDQEDLGPAADGTYALNGITKKAHSKKKRKLMEAMAAAATPVTDAEALTLLASTTPGAPVNPAAGPSRPVPTAKPTKQPLQEDYAALARRKSEKEALRAHRYHAATDLLSRHAITTESQDQPHKVPAPSQPSHQSPQKTILAGQQVLQWLYHILRELGMKSQLDLWAIMALPEVPRQERHKYYTDLGAQVDAAMVKRGGQRYFTAEKQLKVVLSLFAASAPAVPDEIPVNPVPEIPRRDVQAGSSSNGNGYSRHLPTPRSSPQPAKKVMGPIGRPRGRPSAASKMQAQATSIPPPAPLSVPRVQGLQQHTPPSEPASNLPKSSAQNEAQTCPYCKENHDLKACLSMPSPAVLAEYRETIIQSNEAEDAKREGLKRIEQLLQMHVAAGTLTPQTNGEGSPRVAQNGRERPEVIVVEDDDDDAEPAAKRARVEPDLLPRRSPGQKRFHGCSVCRSPRNHAAALCPNVQAGPKSIMEAMKRFDPQDPMWPILRKLYDSHRQSDQSIPAAPQAICPFCREACGRSIRDCAEGRGGRKALKDCIRVLEAARGNEFRDHGMSAEEGDKVVSQLYEAYLQWPKK